MGLASADLFSRASDTGLVASLNQFKELIRQKKEDTAINK